MIVAVPAFAALIMALFAAAVSLGDAHGGPMLACERIHFPGRRDLRPWNIQVTGLPAASFTASGLDMLVGPNKTRAPVEAAIMSLTLCPRNGSVATSSVTLVFSTAASARATVNMVLAAPESPGTSEAPAGRATVVIWSIKATPSQPGQNTVVPAITSGYLRLTCGSVATPTVAVSVQGPQNGVTVEPVSSAYCPVVGTKTSTVSRSSEPSMSDDLTPSRGLTPSEIDPSVSRSQDTASESVSVSPSTTRLYGAPAVPSVTNLSVTPSGLVAPASPTALRPPSATPNTTSEITFGPLCDEPSGYCTSIHLANVWSGVNVTHVTTSVFNASGIVFAERAEQPAANNGEGDLPEVIMIAFACTRNTSSSSPSLDVDGSIRCNLVFVQGGSYRVVGITQVSNVTSSSTAATQPVGAMAAARFDVLVQREEYACAGAPDVFVARSYDGYHRAVYPSQPPSYLARLGATIACPSLSTVCTVANDLNLHCILGAQANTVPVSADQVLCFADNSTVDAGEAMISNAVVLTSPAGSTDFTIAINGVVAYADSPPFAHATAAPGVIAGAVVDPSDGMGCGLHLLVLHNGMGHALCFERLSNSGQWRYTSDPGPRMWVAWRVATQVSDTQILCNPNPFLVPRCMVASVYANEVVKVLDMATGLSVLTDHVGQPQADMPADVDLRPWNVRDDDVTFSAIGVNIDKLAAYVPVIYIASAQQRLILEITANVCAGCGGVDVLALYGLGCSPGPVTRAGFVLCTDRPAAMQLYLTASTVSVRPHLAAASTIALRFIGGAAHRPPLQSSSPVPDRPSLLPLPGAGGYALVGRTRPLSTSSSAVLFCLKGAPLGVPSATGSVPVVFPGGFPGKAAGPLSPFFAKHFRPIFTFSGGAGVILHGSEQPAPPTLVLVDRLIGPPHGLPVGGSVPCEFPLPVTFTASALPGPDPARTRVLAATLCATSVAAETTVVEIALVVAVFTPGATSVPADPMFTWQQLSLGNYTMADFVVSVNATLRVWAVNSEAVAVYISDELRVFQVGHGGAPVLVQRSNMGPLKAGGGPQGGSLPTAGLTATFAALTSVNGTLTAAPCGTVFVYARTTGSGKVGFDTYTDLATCESLFITGAPGVTNDVMTLSVVSLACEPSPCLPATGSGGNVSSQQLFLGEYSVVADTFSLLLNNTQVFGTDNVTAITAPGGVVPASTYAVGYPLPWLCFFRRRGWELRAVSTLMAPGDAGSLVQVFDFDESGGQPQLHGGSAAGGCEARLIESGFATLHRVVVLPSCEIAIVQFNAPNASEFRVLPDLRANPGMVAMAVHVSIATVLIVVDGGTVVGIALPYGLVMFTLPFTLSTTACKSAADGADVEVVPESLLLDPKGVAAVTCAGVVLWYDLPTNTLDMVGTPTAQRVIAQPVNDDAPLLATLVSSFAGVSPWPAAWAPLDELGNVRNPCFTFGASLACSTTLVLTASRAFDPAVATGTVGIYSLLDRVAAATFDLDLSMMRGIRGPLELPVVLGPGSRFGAVNVSFTAINGNASLAGLGDFTVSSLDISNTRMRCDGYCFSADALQQLDVYVARNLDLLQGPLVLGSVAADGTGGVNTLRVLDLSGTWLGPGTALPVLQPALSPPSTSVMPHLETLRLAGCGLSGALWTSLQGLPVLRELDLGGNALTLGPSGGPLTLQLVGDPADSRATTPTDAPMPPSRRRLLLQQPQQPPDANAVELRRINVAGNAFVGTVSFVPLLLPNLTTFDISGNPGLSGTIDARAPLRSPGSPESTLVVNATGTELKRFVQSCAANGTSGCTSDSWIQVDNANGPIQCVCDGADGAQLGFPLGSSDLLCATASNVSGLPETANLTFTLMPLGSIRSAFPDLFVGLGAEDEEASKTLVFSAIVTAEIQAANGSSAPTIPAGEQRSLTCATWYKDWLADPLTGDLLFPRRNIAALWPCLEAMHLAYAVARRRNVSATVSSATTAPVLPPPVPGLRHVSISGTAANVTVRFRDAANETNAATFTAEGNCTRLPEAVCGSETQVQRISFRYGFLPYGTDLTIQLTGVGDPEQVNKTLPLPIVYMPPVFRGFPSPPLGNGTVAPSVEMPYLYPMTMLISAVNQTFRLPPVLHLKSCGYADQIGFACSWVVNANGYAPAVSLSAATCATFDTIRTCDAAFAPLHDFHEENINDALPGDFAIKGPSVTLLWEVCPKASFQGSTVLNGYTKLKMPFHLSEIFGGWTVHRGALLGPTLIGCADKNAIGCQTQTTSGDYVCGLIGGQLLLEFMSCAMHGEDISSLLASQFVPSNRNATEHCLPSAFPSLRDASQDANFTRGDLGTVLDIIQRPLASPETVVHAVCYNEGKSLAFVDEVSKLPLYTMDSGDCAGARQFTCSSCLPYLEPYNAALPYSLLLIASLKDIVLMLVGLVVLERPGVRKTIAGLIARLVVLALPYDRVFMEYEEHDAVDDDDDDAAGGTRRSAGEELRDMTAADDGDASYVPPSAALGAPDYLSRTADPEIGIGGGGGASLRTAPREDIEDDAAPAMRPPPSPKKKKSTVIEFDQWLGLWQERFNPRHVREDEVQLTYCKLRGFRMTLANATTPWVVKEVEATSTRFRPSSPNQSGRTASTQRPSPGAHGTGAADNDDDDVAPLIRPALDANASVDPSFSIVKTPRPSPPHSAREGNTSARRAPVIDSEDPTKGQEAAEDYDDDDDGARRAHLHADAAAVDADGDRIPSFGLSPRVASEPFIMLRSKQDTSVQADGPRVPPPPVESSLARGAGERGEGDRFNVQGGNTSNNGAPVSTSGWSDCDDQRDLIDAAEFDPDDPGYEFFKLIMLRRCRCLLRNYDEPAVVATFNDLLDLAARGEGGVRALTHRRRKWSREELKLWRKLDALADLSDCIMLESDAVDRKFTPQIWMLSVEFVYAFIMLVVCLFEDGEHLGHPFTRYEAKFFAFVNSCTSVGFVVNAALRFMYAGNGRPGFFFFASVAFMVPPLITHIIPGLVIFFFLPLLVIPITFAILYGARQVKLRGLGWTGMRWQYRGPAEKWLFLAVNVASRLAATYAVTLLFQTLFNYMVLFNHRDELGLSWPFGIVGYEARSRRWDCLFERWLSDASKALQLWSTFV